MKPILKAAMAGLLTAAIAGGGLLGLASASFAAGSAPAWEPDGNAAPPYGNLTFYDANGNPVTSGTSLEQPFRLCRGRHGRRHWSHQGYRHLRQPKERRAAGLLDRHK